ncbi:hypothetical protein NLG97_g4757 [Lecanicillium saksenae]|uniref:Uncharacterized protein n=1 Tax=Lecanicillium saksenae TaxID=468837 RepID=A0ACC1QUJ6_9HYPO|nr:hypothetical protein NLG97_g4757 [Lecanicillium saksenae]
MAVPGISAPGLGEAESHVLQQYEKIIRFRDEILAGKHATIKLPNSLREAALSLSTDAILESSAGSLPGQNNNAFASNAQRDVGTPSLATPNVVPSIQPRPINLSKTEQLLRAQLQIQRKRIEQGLQDDVLKNRQTKTANAATQDGLDASSILAAALILVPELDLSAREREGAGSGNGAENDSFDDNTFYSSQHDTPEFQPASPVPISPVVPAASTIPTHPSTTKAAPEHAGPARNQDQRRSVNNPRQLRTYEELTEPATVKPPAKKQSNPLPGLSSYNGNTVMPPNQGNATAAAPASLPAATTQPSSYIDLHPPSPLLQNNARAAPSYAAQPVQANDIPGLYGNMQNPASNSGAPAQVAALRSEPGSRTSPDSSSQGGNSKRKNRRKKRKSDRQALESQQSFESGSHHIKAEPRSPSPLAGPSYIRPNKRQRQLNPQSQDSPYDDMSYDPAMPGPSSSVNEPTQQPQYRQDRTNGMYTSTARAMPSNARVSREYVTERVITDDGYRREYVPQPALPYEYASRGRPVHSDAYQDGALPYGTSPQATRYSVHPEGDAFHESTRPQPARILVDAYGREYIEPARQIIRHSMAPSPLPGEAERLYERAPPQPLPRYQGPGALEERGYMFTQPASPYAAPRRILTQPEYVTYENRDVRYREYSARPLAASGEFVPVRPQEHRVYADGGREYIGRASSMHPVEQARVPSGLGPYGHASNVRPEASGVLYGIERSAQPTAIKSYGAWPSNQGIVGRENGGSLYAAAPPNEAGSSRGAGGPDPMYGRGNRQDGFRQ